MKKGKIHWSDWKNLDTDLPLPPEGSHVLLGRNDPNLSYEVHQYFRPDLMAPSKNSGPYRWTHYLVLEAPQ